MNELPSNWLALTLGDVVDYGSNQNVQPDSMLASQWMIELEDIERDTSRIISRASVEQRKPQSAKSKFQAGNVLYGKLRPYLNKVVHVDFDGYCSNEIIAISSGELNARYLFYFLKSPTFLSYVSAVTHGVRMPRLGTDQARSAPFPLAPANEQKRIALALDSLMGQVENLRARIDKIPQLIKRFRESVLHGAVSGRLTETWRSAHPEKTAALWLQGFSPLPPPPRYKSRSDAHIMGVCATSIGKPKSPLVEAWEWIPLFQIARMESGHTPSKDMPAYWNGDVPWIGIKDARANHEGTIYSTQQSTNQSGLDNSAARLLPAGTVCISRTASVGYVVKMGVPMATSQDFVNWVPTQYVDAEWLKWLFVAEKESLFRFGKGSTHTTIYFPEWLSLHVALPHLEEQVEIAKRVQQLLSLADGMTARVNDAKKRIDALTQSILAKAFRGELVPQDPNDEPASVLLERIRAQRAAAPKPKRGRKAAAN